MNAPSRHRRPGPTRLQKVSAAAGIAAVGATALGFTAVGKDDGGVRTAGAELAAQPVAWDTGVQSPAQKSSIEAQSSRADDQAHEEAKAEARQQEETKQRAVAARAAAEEKRKAEAAEKKERARQKAEREREREKQAASRSAEREEPAGSEASGTPSGSPQQMARQIIGDESQFQCFSEIVERESGWDHQASNPSSGAYGLVQALPGSKMSSAGADWKTNPATQIKWGLNYMNDRYDSPCGAWDFWQANNWY